jgi:L-aminopeptidase/D-esterase-like protein
MKPLDTSTLLNACRVSIGHAEDVSVKSGVTVILPDAAQVCAVHVLGGAPGTRETDLLMPEQTVQAVDAIAFSGGSAFGLDAASGVQAWLREAGRGHLIEPFRIPIVPAAILFDLRNGGDKDWGRYPPYRDLGFTAAGAASRNPALGAAGAAFGAKTATTPGGFGIAGQALDSDIVVAAAVAVNAVGSPMVGDTQHFWAAPFEVQAEFGGRGYPHPWPANARDIRLKSGHRVQMNTTLAVVMTNTTLNKAQAKRLAMMAHDGFARALYPAHTVADGDLIFTLASGDVALPDGDLVELGTAAANVCARAIARGVFEASINI